MVEKLKEIKEKLNLLIQEVEQLENSIYGQEIIIEKKDFDKLKRIGSTGWRQIFQFFNGPVFGLNYEGSSDAYQNAIFKALIEKTLDRIILLKLEKSYNLTEKEGGFLITHRIESEIDTKLRDAYCRIR